MTGSAPTPSTPPANDKWWLVAIVAGLLAMGQAALVMTYPTSRFTWIVAAGLLVFAAVMYYRPATWYRRMSATFLGLAGLSGAAPSISAAIDITDQGMAGIVIDNSPVVTVVFVSAAVAFAIIDLMSRRSKPAGNTNNNHQHNPWVE